MRLPRLIGIAIGLLLPLAANAQSLNIDLGSAGEEPVRRKTGRIVQLTALVTVLSLAPSLLVMLTAFTRIVIVLSLLRSALSTQGTPPNMVLIGSCALFLTFFVMQPVLNDAWTTGLLPLSQGRVGELEGLRLASEPFHRFMTANLFAPHRPSVVPRYRPSAAAAGHGFRALAGAGSRLPGGRIAARLRDGVPALPSLHGHRHGCRKRADEPWHDDAAAERGLTRRSS